MYTSQLHGGLGLTSLEDMLSSATIARVLRCLNSRDQLVKDVSWTQLSAVVRKRSGKEHITDLDVETFLNTTVQCCFSYGFYAFS